MKTMMCVVCFGICLVSLSAPAVPSAAGDRYYEDYLGKKMDHCLCKAHLLRSRSENLRQYAILKMEKAAFIRSNAPELLSGLKSCEGRLKPYQIDRYLNQAFRDGQRGNLHAGN